VILYTNQAQNYNVKELSSSQIGERSKFRSKNIIERRLIH
jgi:hypothetical protein